MKYTPIFAAIFLLASCKVTFNEYTRQQIENNRVSLSKIQFYNSEKIVLKRTLSVNDLSVTSGKVRVEDGKYTEIIRIKKHTRGKCESVNNKNLYISFEAGQNKSFRFTNKFPNQADRGYELNPDDCKIEKKSSIALSNGKKNGLPIETVQNDINVCSVLYDGKTYTAELPVMPYLLIKKSKYSKRQVKRRTAKGVKVD